MFILVADSNRTMREQLVKWLVERRHQAVGAADFATLGSLLAARPPDAILVDTALGPVSTADLIRKLRVGTGASLPYIVALLDREPSRALPDLLEMGFDDFVRRTSPREEVVARLETPVRLRARGGNQSSLPSVALDWSGSNGGLGAADWLRAAPVVTEAISQMLGIRLEPVDRSDPLPSPAHAATISVTGVEEAEGVDIALVVAPAALLACLRLLVGDCDASLESLEDVLREMVNAAAGGFKRCIQADGRVLTTGLPQTLAGGAIPSLGGHKAHRFTCRIAGTGHDLTLLLSDRVRSIEWVPGSSLREGMILMRDLHSESGCLLLSGGTRISSTAAARISRMVGQRLLEVCLGA